MIPLVSPTITDTDRAVMRMCASDGSAFEESTVRRFEEAFAERVGCAGAVAVCSGTSALQIVLRALGLGYDYERESSSQVGIPTYACSAIDNAVRMSEAVPAYADTSFNVREARGAQAWVKADSTVVVHMFGRSTHMPLVPEVEDWTLSLGYADDGILGRAGVCSTHASKMISTGRGGVVFSNDTELLDEVRALAYYDTTPNGNLGAYSLGMSSMQAALGLSQLRQLDAFIERRRDIATRYSAIFEHVGIECPDAECGSVFFRYLIGVEDPAGKVAALAEHGIEAGRGVYPPLHRQLGLSDDAFPGATACVNRLLSVPCHPSLTDAHVAVVIEKVKEVCAP